MININTDNGISLVTFEAEVTVSVATEGNDVPINIFSKPSCGFRILHGIKSLRCWYRDANADVLRFEAFLWSLAAIRWNSWVRFVTDGHDDGTETVGKEAERSKELLRPFNGKPFSVVLLVVRTVGTDNCVCSKDVKTFVIPNWSGSVYGKLTTVELTVVDTVSEDDTEEAAADDDTSTIGCQRQSSRIMGVNGLRLGDSFGVVGLVSISSVGVVKRTIGSFFPRVRR